MTLIEMHQINKHYKMSNLETTVLNDISLNIHEGEYLSICGPSGSGKSSLLSIMGLLSCATSGSYLIKGQDVSHLKQGQLAVLRNQDIGFIFQAFNLNADMTTEENIELPLTYRKGLSRKQRKFAVAAIIEKLFLSEYRQYYPGQISGGQQQRVAIARALVGQPRIILADEPTGNLDSKNAAAVMEIFNDLNTEGVTICLVTHDPRSAAYARRKIQLFDGAIINTTEIGKENNKVIRGVIK